MPNATLDSPSPDPLRHAWAGAFVLFLLCFAVAHRHGVRLSFDSYYYVELAKEFRTRMPPSFGNAWPFGWPLLGSATGWLGLPAYHGLLLLSMASVAGLLFLTHRALPWSRLNPAGALSLASGAACFMVVAATAAVFSELPFALVLLGFALSLSRWPERRAIWSSAALALAALTLRYAGGILLLVLGGWFLLQLSALRRARGVTPALLALACAGTLAAGLLFWNLRATGFWSGYPRGASVPSAMWIRIASDFGWSLPTLLGGFGLRDILGFTTGLRLPLGLVFLAATIALAGAGWRTPNAGLKALALTSAAYAIGLITLRCVGEFDPLHNGRMALPLLCPTLLLASSLLPTRLVTVLGAGLLILNAFLCVRGASLQIGADVRSAVPVVNTGAVGETIAVNEHALTIAAFVSLPVNRLPVAGVSFEADQNRFIVIAAPPLDRTGRHGNISDDWMDTKTQLLRSGRYRERLDLPGLAVLERSNRASVRAKAQPAANSMTDEAAPFSLVRHDRSAPAAPLRP